MSQDFENILKRFQGKQPMLPAKVYEDVEKYFSSRSVDHTRETMEDALKETRNERYYKDVTHLCHKIWGMEPPVISPEDEQLLIMDYKITNSLKRPIKGARNLI